MRLPWSVCGSSAQTARGTGNSLRPHGKGPPSRGVSHRLAERRTGMCRSGFPTRACRPRPCPSAGDLGQSRGKPTSPPCIVARPCPSQAVNRCLPTAKSRLAFLSKTRLKDSGAAIRAPVTFAPPPHRTAARLVLRREHRPRSRVCGVRPLFHVGWPSMFPWFPFCMGRSVCLRVYPKGRDLSLTRREEIKMM